MVIDIFLTWVDGSDQNWLNEKNKYAMETVVQKEVNGSERYRSWDNLQYLFRGIETCIPWVNKVFLVTCGQIPSFLNIDHPKLRLVNHKDYIPEKYLPTFNSNTIEMNLFRLDDLSENFILFNDDTFPISPIPETYFFKNDTVCDEAIERIIGNVKKRDYAYVMLNNAWIINKYFNKRKVKRENFWKWYYPGYGKQLFRNVVMNYFHDFEGLRNPHEPFAMKKSTFKKLWELETEILDQASKNRFRNYTDVTQYIARYWQIFEGNFYPRLHQGRAWLVNDNNYKNVISCIKEQKYPLICIDEDTEEKFSNYEVAKKEINLALAELFPYKSSFEL